MGDLDDIAPRRTRRARVLGRLLALALGTLIALCLVEGGFRLWKSIQGEPFDRVQAGRRMDELVARLKGVEFVPKNAGRTDAVGGMSLHPYEGYQIASAWKFEDNPGAEYADQECPKNYDLLILGGSVAVEFGNLSSEVLMPILEAAPQLAGRKIRIHNRACPGHKQPQLGANLLWALSLGIRPDAVLLLDGFNELAVAAQNANYDVHPLYPAWLTMQTALSGPLSDPENLEIAANIFALRCSAEQLALRAHRFGALHSAVLGSLVGREFEDFSSRSGALLARLQQVEIRRKEGRPLFVRGPNFDHDPASILRMSALAWLEGSRSMQAVCRARQIHFIHVLQPAARDKGAKPLTAKEAQASLEPEEWRLAVENGYPRLREAGAQLVREGVNFHDASRVFAEHPEEIYRDPCHFGIEGCTILGAFVAQAIIESWPNK